MSILSLAIFYLERIEYLLISMLSCPICGGKQREETKLHFIILNECLSCKQHKYHYNLNTNVHRYTIGDITYILSEALEEDEYEQLNETIMDTIVAAQEKYKLAH